jgi:hypothetical protein
MTFMSVPGKGTTLQLGDKDLGLESAPTQRAR